MSNKPTITTSRGRVFAVQPAAILVFIVNPAGEILLLSNPRGNGGWEIVNGAIEHDETILESALRETREEAGPHLRLKPLGTVHTYTHLYDPDTPMISIAYLMAYQGGDVVPGDDMRGSEVWWATPDQIESASTHMLVPRQRWLARRAVDLYHLWADAPIPPLEKSPDQQGGIKYEKDDSAF